MTYDDRKYCDHEVAEFFAAGASPQVIANWPWITLPRAVEVVARAGLMDDPVNPHGQEELEEALRPRRGFRTEWGCIVVEHEEAEMAGEDSLFYISGYLDDDPYLKLPHLCSDVDEVGAFLSDVVHPSLEDVAEKHLGRWLEWMENDTTNRLFSAIAFFNPAQSDAFLGIGEEFSRWLAAADIRGLLSRCAHPDHLARLEQDGSVFTSSLPRACLN